MNKLNLSLPVMHRQTKLDIISLMEPVLRTQVMIAQSQAGMWRRNGYSLLNQVWPTCSTTIPSPWHPLHLESQIEIIISFKHNWALLPLPYEGNCYVGATGCLASSRDCNIDESSIRSQKGINLSMAPPIHPPSTLLTKEWRGQIEFIWVPT